MSVLKASRSAQWPLSAEFVFNFDDTMINTSGVSDGFASVATHVFDVIPLPPNAVVLSGEVVTETAATGPTAYNISVGDSGSATRYLGATDRVAAGRTALVPTGYVSAGENLRITVQPTVAPATTGKFSVKITYMVRGRSNEVQIN